MKSLPVLFFVALLQIANAQITDTMRVIKQIDSLNQEVFKLSFKNKNKEALELSLHVESLAASQLGKESAIYARARFYHSVVLSNSNQRLEAEQLLLEVKDLQARIVGEEHPDFATTVYQLGCNYYYRSNYPEALRYMEQSYHIRYKVLGKNHRDYGESIYFLAFLLRKMGDVESAEPLVHEYVDFCKVYFGPTHFNYGRSLGDLALLFNDKAEYRKAELTYLEAIRVMSEAGGGNEGSYGMTLNYLGNVYRTTGQFEKAEPKYLEALAHQRKVRDQARKIAITLANLASIYDLMGNFKEAERYGLEAVKIYEQNIGTESPNYHIALSALSQIYLHQEDYAKAEEYGLKTLDIQARLTGKEHTDYALSLLRLGSVYEKQGKLELALNAALECNHIHENNKTQEHTFLGTVQLFLATLYDLQGQLNSAESAARNAQQYYQNSIGKDNTYYISAIRKLAKINWSKGDLKSAFDLMEESSLLDRMQLQKATGHLSERELTGYTEKFLEGLHSELSFALIQKDIVGTCYDDILFQKGFLLNNLSRLNNLIERSEESASKFASLKALRHRLAAAYTKPLTDRDTLQILTLEGKANVLEKEIIREKVGYAEATSQVSWTEVKQRLQVHEAALEFVQFRFFNPNPTDSILYAALILLKNAPHPLLIPLFEEKQLAPLIKGASGGSNFLKINALYEQPELYNLIWKPLEPALQGITTLYTSPSGLLHRINLAAIRSPNGKTVGETKQLVLMGSTRQLVQPQSSKDPYSATAYLAGGIRYHSDSIAIGYALREAGTRGINNTYSLPFYIDSIEARAGDLRYLPATASEVQEIGQRLKNARFEVRTDTGFYATEESFRQLGASETSPILLHLATHGFFFPDPVKSKNSSTTGSVFKLSDHPMIRSGLIMAGAQNAWQGKKTPANQEDGILTAYEISQMNLSNTQLVVLSACETGLGDIAGNEGVYGLQRAFKIAGARYLIMSLWKVDDQSTKAFMTTFYQEWLDQKRSIPDAFRQTQQKMSKKYPNPYDWAGFILIE